MGINVGDIIRDGRDIYGDGVNVAGRLERVRCRLPAGGRWIRTIGPATEKLPSGAPCGFRARLHQLGEALIPRGTKSSNPSPSSRESANFRFLSRRALTCLSAAQHYRADAHHGSFPLSGPLMNVRWSDIGFEPAQKRRESAIGTREARSRTGRGLLTEPVLKHSRDCARPPNRRP
jgi:hypothetical protein